jgi:hypothetical protein
MGSKNHRGWCDARGAVTTSATLRYRPGTRPRAMPWWEDGRYDKRARAANDPRG